jgi:23S rRNA pseudouridine1911/1915/1917 synthase
MTHLSTLYDAGGVLAVAKPAGLPTQAPAGIPSAESIVRERLFGAADVGAGRRRHPGGFLGVPHRLDRAVSGVLLFATTPRAARQLARQFERRQIRKTYLAIVRPSAGGGSAVGTTFEWRDTIRKVPDEPRAEIVPPGTAGGRDAVTTGRVLAAAAEGTRLVELEPVTGRMHQLRLQAATRGLAVVGDSLYGGWSPAAAGPPAARSAAIGLHASRITFRDPATGTETTVACPPPAGPLWQAYPQAGDTPGSA